MELGGADLAVHPNHAHDLADTVDTVVGANDILQQSVNEKTTNLKNLQNNTITHFHTLEDVLGVVCTNAVNTMCNRSCNIGISDI